MIDYQMTGNRRVGDGSSNVFTQQALHYLPNKSTPGCVAFLQSPSTYVQLFRSPTDYRIPRILRRLWLCPQWWYYYRRPAFSGASLLSCSSSASSWTNVKPWFASTDIIWILKMVFLVVLEMLFLSTGLLRVPEVFFEVFGSRSHGSEWREAQSN